MNSITYFKNPGKYITLAKKFKQQQQKYEALKVYSISVN